MTKPLLSIGIIFKDDIRCIENCLKALQPLRDAIPCELVMADTGSADGSREVAERYADVLFDFPWIDDFSAARNAVIDRCCAEWFLSVDTDEYFSTGIGQLEAFLARKEHTEVGGTVIVRNYYNYELTGFHTDFMAIRLMHISQGFRYEGAIHEGWNLGPENRTVAPLNEVVFNHDGYVEMGKNTPRGKAKSKRNLKLIRTEIEKHPEDLMCRLQLLESATAEPDYVEQVRMAVELLRQKKSRWEMAGPPLLRYAVYAANNRSLPELDEWIQMALEWFPNSMYTRLDVEWVRFITAWNKKEHTAAIASGERYLVAMEDYRAGADPGARTISILHMADPGQEQKVKVLLVGAYCNTGTNFERALELLHGLNYEETDAQQTADILKNLQEIHFRSWLDTAPLIEEVWEGITAPVPSQKEAAKRKGVFYHLAGMAFEEANWKDEETRSGFCRYAYTLYRPLHKECGLGTAVNVMETESASELEQLLPKVADWGAFPIDALFHALERGVRFPIPDRQINVEETDSLAGRLSKDWKRLLPLALQAAQESGPEDWKKFVWTRGLLMAAVRAYPWSGEKQEQETEQGMALARALARMEGEFLPLCYAPSVLAEDRLFVLPPMHRFGWYCSKAFAALESGDTAGYVRLLREGLSSSESMKSMVEFLLNHTPELQTPAPSAELRALADQIRAVLANFAPDDPAVEALKQSEAYQKVAYLIEGTKPPILGGQLQ